MLGQKQLKRLFLKFKDESSGTLKCFKKFFVGFFTGSGPEKKMKFGTFDKGVLESSKTG